MNLFDSLVDSALKSQPDLVILRMVVEKEILHHDILREMAKAGLLEGLTFIGGTCLRDCYGSFRLSEDLDFTGGTNFDRKTLASLGDVLVTKLYEKYGLTVSVAEPIRETGNVNTWKLKMVTRTGQTHLPEQRINIDICSIVSHEKQPAMLRNYYNIDLGTSGLIINAESRDEILADKVIALALRPNRVKNRDLWDILYLINQNAAIKPDLIELKQVDRHITPVEFNQKLSERLESLSSHFDEYCFEMQRFLPVSQYSRITEQAGYWEYLLTVIREIKEKVCCL